MGSIRTSSSNNYFRYKLKCDENLQKSVEMYEKEQLD